MNSSRHQLVKIRKKEEILVDLQIIVSHTVSDMQVWLR